MKLREVKNLSVKTKMILLEGLTIFILSMLLADVMAGWGHARNTARVIKTTASRIESNLGGK